MSASPINLASGNITQAASQAGKQSDSATPDVPFSQVLSGEMAQARKSDAPQAGSDAGTKTDPAAPAADAKPDPATAPASAAAAKADPAQPAKAGEKAAHGKDKDDAATAEASPVAPETLLGLPIGPDAFRPAAVAAETTAAVGTAPETALGRDAAAVPVLGAPGAPGTDAADATGESLQSGRKGRTLPFAQAARQAGDKPGTRTAKRAGEEHAAQRLDPHLSGKADPPAAGAAHAAAASEAASAFQGQLATARHADAGKTGDLVSDIASNPAMRLASHAPADILPTSADASSSRLAPTVGTTAWGQALGEKLVWMASGTQQTASLTLNPPNLGPLQVVVNVTNDQATASFFSAQPEVRHALEAAFPRLREMMSDAGIQLGQASVSADTPQQQNTPDRQAQRIAPAFLGSDPATPAGMQAVQPLPRQSGRGLIDTFA